MALEKLVQIRKITQYKDGCIYKTEFIEERWVPIDTQMYVVNENNEQICSLPPHRLAELQGMGGTIRRSK